MTSASVGYLLVTGGNSGIGRAFVERFVAEGASVVARGRNEITLQALKAAHPSVEARRCDVASISEVDALAEFVSRRYGRLDVLVNNAGVMEQVDMLARDVDAAAITRDGTQSGGGRNLGVHRTATRRVLRRASSVAAVTNDWRPVSPHA
ncbi:MAG: SDR family NAD(P)-dependent oxidoreductase [Gammaproteobacteria bacterium]